MTRPASSLAVRVSIRVGWLAPLDSRSSERCRLEPLAESGDEGAAAHHGFADLRQLQGRLVQLRRAPDFRDPKRIGVAGIGRHHVTEAARHRRGAFDQNGGQPIAGAGGRTNPGNEAEHALRLLAVVCPCGAQQQRRCDDRGQQLAALGWHEADDAGLTARRQGAGATK